MIEEGAQEAAIGAFLLAHEGHTQEVEVQRGAWSIYCRCTRCDDIHTFEVDNEARERAIGLPPWPRACYELGRKSHRNADFTVRLVPSRSLFPAFLSRF